MGPFIEKFLWNKKETYLVYLKQIRNKNKCNIYREWIEIFSFFSSDYR